MDCQGNHVCHREVPFFSACFMMEHSASRDGSGCTAKNGKSQKKPFRNPPQIISCLQFVQTVGQKCGHVESTVPDNQKHRHFFMLETKVCRGVDVHRTESAEKYASPRIPDCCPPEKTGDSL